MTDPLSVAVPRDGALTHVLPAPRTRLFGRDAEIEEICRLLDQGAPVTITGPGGIGKTRVAIEVSRRQQRRVVFVQLADVDRTAVASAITRACTPGTPVLPAGLPPTATFTFPPSTTARFAVNADTAVGETSLAASSGRRWTDQAADLPSQPTVLVLDTFEHVTAAAGLVTDLLAALPALLILVTSRCRLGLRDEQVVPLGGLGVAADGPAASLFRDRARRAGSHRAPPSAADDAAVVQLCDLLGGVPLAIELAAARTALMRPAALLAQLRRTDNRRVLGLLARGAIDLPSRQVSMRATMSWSYQLLDGAQQTLFRRLGVFPGTFDLETAEQVCTDVSAEDGWIEPDAVLNGIAALVDLHLVEPAAPVAAWSADQARFTLPDASRAFAAELLEMSGERADLDESLQQWCLGFGRRAGDGLASTDEASWLDRVAEELPALRRTLAGLADAEDGARGLPLAIALGTFWAVRGPVIEGLRWLTTFLEMDRSSQQLPAQLHAIGAGWAGRLALAAGAPLDVDSVRSSRSTVLAYPHTPQLWLAASDPLARALVAAGERTEALSIINEAIRIARTVDNAFWLSEYLHRRAELEWMTGDHRWALAHAQEALAVATTCGHPRIGARSQVLVAACLLAGQAPIEARAAALPALRSLRDAGDQRGGVIAMSVLAIAEMDSGSVPAAAAVVRDAINQARQIGFDGAEFHCCLITAMLACRTGRYAEAIELDDALAHPDGAPPGRLPPALVMAYAEAIAGAHAAAGTHPAAPADGRGWGWLRARSLELVSRIAATPVTDGTGPVTRVTTDATPPETVGTSVVVASFGATSFGAASFGADFDTRSFVESSFVRPNSGRRGFDHDGVVHGDVDPGGVDPGGVDPGGVDPGGRDRCGAAGR